jgi:hydroxyacylglutathione hydrolase
VPGAGPGGQYEEDLRSVPARDGAPLVGLEMHERADRRLDLLAARPDDRRALDDDEPGVLLHLVVAQLLAGVEADKDRARLLLAEEDDRRAASPGRGDLGQLPGLHERASVTPPLHSATAMALDVKQLPLGPVQTNCYLVRRPGETEGVVVDPGADAARIRVELDAWKAKCAAILITHGDWDHLGAVADLAEEEGAPVHMAEDEREGLERLADYLPAGLGITARSYTPDVLLAGDEKLTLAQIEFETLRVPGHTPAHLAYFADGCLFSGDVLFAGGVGRVDRPGGDWETLLASIRMLAARFPPETVVYSGHGPPTTLGEEIASNPFLADLRAAAR